MHIDPLSSIPKYKQIAAFIQQKIDSGDWVVYEPIPSERELEAKFRVSRTTIRQALEYVANTGLVYREHGKGTFVARPKEQHSLEQLTSFTSDMRSRGSEPGQKILSLTYVEPEPKVIQALKAENERMEVLRIERLRFADDEPISIHRAFLMFDIDIEITASDLQVSGSLYSLLEREHGIVPLEADETIEATAANPDEAALLNVAPGTPLLLISRTTYSQTRKPFEYVEMLYRADRYKCFAHLSRKERIRIVGA